MASFLPSSPDSVCAEKHVRDVLISLSFFIKLEDWDSTLPLGAVWKILPSLPAATIQV